MEDSTNPSLMNQNLSPSSTCICANEISIRNHTYIISMCINHSEEPQLDIKVEAKESADQWRSSFDVAAIEAMTAKTGNYKSFIVFVNMLENAINQKSSSVSIDLFTCDDLELIRKQQQQAQRKPSSTKSSMKRYLILIYNAEYDCIHYPLSLRYCGKPDPVILIEQIRQLAVENQLLKFRFEVDNERFDLQEECSHLRKENDDYRQQLSLYNLKEKDEQVEFLRQMIRASEDALSKERNNLQKTKTKKNDRSKILINQIELSKTSERQLKLKVKSLTNEIDLLKKNCSSSKVQQRSSSLSRPISSERRRYRSASVTKRCPSSSDSHVRFNPTAYVHERNLKLRQIKLEKKNETRRTLSSGRHHSDSDISDVSLKSNGNDPHTSNFKKSSSRKRTNNLHRRKSKDSIDSDIERVSSPSVSRKHATNNSTILFSPEYSYHNQQILDSNPPLKNSTSTDNMIDIDQRLKSLERFIKQNFLR